MSHTNPKQGELDQSRPQGTAALVGDIILDAQKLIRREIDLAKAQLKDEGRKAKVTLIVFGVAMAMALTGLFSLSLSFVFFLSSEYSVSLWLSFLITTLVFALSAAALGFWARFKLAKFETTVTPRTTESVKENVKWIRNQT